MTIKRLKIITTIGIFALCFLTHFLYDWFPNPLFSCFFPVNESIWEHMKMIYTTTILFGIIEYIIILKTNLKVSHFSIELFITALIAIPIYLLFYLPFYYRIGSPMILNLVVLFVSIGLSQIIGYWILKIKRKINHSFIIGIVMIIIGFIGMGYLTYKPIKTDLFFDKMEEKYGLSVYNI